MQSRNAASASNCLLDCGQRARGDAISDDHSLTCMEIFYRVLLHPVAVHWLVSRAHARPGHWARRTSYTWNFSMGPEHEVQAAVDPPAITVATEPASGPGKFCCPWWSPGVLSFCVPQPLRAPSCNARCTHAMWNGWRQAWRTRACSAP